MRKLVLGILCIASLLLLRYSAYPRYVTWKQNHLLAMARAFAAQADLRNARLSLTELLSANPRNIEANRLIADLAEAEPLAAALALRQRVVELDPRSSNDRLALAAIALKMHDLTSASNALAGIQEGDKKTAAYHNIAGAVCVAANQLAAAEAHYLEAIRLEPEDPAPEISLAVLRLHTTNGDAAIQARQTLGRLGSNSTNSMARWQALRELTLDALQHHQKEASLAWSKQLVEETNSVFSDRLLQLQALWETQNEKFKTELASLRSQAQSDPGKIQELMGWQLGKVPPAESLAWLRSLPAAIQTNPPVELLKAGCCMELQDWPGLQACVEKGNWAAQEFARHAFQARALRGQAMSDAAHTEWGQAMQAANGQMERLIMLLRLTERWTWLDERQDVLRAILDAHPNEDWARQALAQSLFASGQTRSLMQLYSQEATRNPSDPVAKNTVAMTALLLDAQELNPHQKALELYHECATNASFATTYAFSLYQLGKQAEALRVLDGLDPQLLETAYVAPCYGLVLRATGNLTKAKKYLDLASKFPMLPEERNLIERASSGLDEKMPPKS
jgi:tetratricopeptide (TPR) repeat protein